MLSEYVLLQEDEVVHIPANLTWEEAATLPCAALTAWSALNGTVPIQAGDVVLTMGSGGVPLFAIQFANLFGAKVIALTSKSDRFAKLQALGAKHVINYSTDKEWSNKVLELTGGQGVNRVVETGGTDTFEQSVNCTAFGGEIALVSPYGRASELTVSYPALLNRLFVGLITVRPLFVGSRISFEQMNKALETYNIKPVIAKQFSFEEAQEAYRFFATGAQLGKVVIFLNA